MSRLSPLFWTVATLDALLLAVFLVISLRQGSHGDGGREMAIFFFIVVPSLVLLAAGLLFHYGSSTLAKGIALFIVAVPGLFFAKTQIDNLLIDRRIEADRAGVGYFSGEAMRAMGAAVVNRDVATLLRIGPSVDVNTAGDRGMTLLALAIDSDHPRPAGRVEGDELPVVRALLSLGAHPDAGLDSASKRDTPELLALLLDAGANPNLRTDDGEPLVFKWKSVLKPANLRLLAEHGLDLNSVSYEDPLPVVLTIYRRWDLLAVLIELGADTTRPRPDGRNVAGELTSQIAEETAAGREPPADLLRAKALLDASRASAVR